MGGKTNPGTAEKASVEKLHPKFVPLVMSFNIEGFEYNAGLMNPTVLLLALSRCSLIRLMRDATIGVLADVPPLRPYLRATN
jgi:hypothetical protein